MLMTCRLMSEAGVEDLMGEARHRHRGHGGRHAMVGGHVEVGKSHGCS